MPWRILNRVFFFLFFPDSWPLSLSFPHLLLHPPIYILFTSAFQAEKFLLSPYLYSALQLFRSYLLSFFLSFSLCSPLSLFLFLSLFCLRFILFLERVHLCRRGRRRKTDTLLSAEPHVGLRAPSHDPELLT